jgi:superfamily II DNA or RNA helicase
MPTGTGKTILFALLAKKINKRTLILAHTDELIQQAVDKIQRVWSDVDIGVVKSYRNELQHQIVVASIQTVRMQHRLAQLVDQNFEVMVIDESHHAASDSYKLLMDTLGFSEKNITPNKLLVGVTATPRRSDEKGLKSIFGDISFSRTMGEMVRSGFLCPLKAEAVRLDFQTFEKSKHIIEMEKNQEEISIEYWFKYGPVRRAMVDSFEAHGINRKKTIVFCLDIKHCTQIANEMQSRGINAKAIHGKIKEEERRQILKDFDSGKISVISNCMVLTEGFDQPDLDCIMMCRPTKSPGLYMQMIGRGTRTFVGKENCLIIDFTSNSQRYKDVCNAISMLTDDELREGIAQDQEKQTENKEDAEKERSASNPPPEGEVKETGFSVINLTSENPGANKGRMFKIDKHGNTITIDLFDKNLEPNALHGAAKSIYKNIMSENAKWKKEPISNKQFLLLKKFKWIPELKNMDFSSLTRGAASSLINAAFEMAKNTKKGDQWTV